VEDRLSDPLADTALSLFGHALGEHDAGDGLLREAVYHMPKYVLISGRTASAAESLAYTLQAARRATVIGEISAGAANPGGAFPVGDGFEVFVSISSPVNPVTGTNWNIVGVKPDINRTR
jgi:C-terminal processing protease CtpA/Prc